MKTKNITFRGLYTFPRMDRRLIWIGLGLFTWVVNYLFQLNPAFTEIVYSRGIFLLLRWVWDYTLGWLPFPLLYLAVPLILAFFFRKGIKAIQNYQQVRWRYRIGSFLFSLLAFLGAVFFLFQFMWGFNYYRVPVAEQMGLTLSAPDSNKVYTEAALAQQMILEVYAKISHKDDQPLLAKHLPENLEAELRANLTQVLAEWEYPTPGRVRSRIVFPKGLLMRLGASGIYIPFVGEGHIDAALPPVSQPFTLAHEMAHGYGIGNEGSANFWAYLTTEQSSHPAIQYSGRLAYWRYAMRQLRLLDTQAFQQHLEALPKGIQADMAAVREAYRQYPDFFPEFNERAYNSYLQSQGVKEGILSYQQLVALVQAWRVKAAKHKDA